MIVCVRFLCAKKKGKNEESEKKKKIPSDDLNRETRHALIHFTRVECNDVWRVSRSIQHAGQWG